MIVPFDPANIRDEAIRDRYKRILRRGDTIAATMRGTFGPDHAPIRMRFVDEPTFNAYASRDAQGYLLELTRPVPLLLLVLFERLLADPRVFPWLDASGDVVTDYGIDFVADPANFSLRERWQIKLTEGRAFAASILADIATAFIQLHELGHIIGGHIEANHHLTGRWAVAEMLDTEFQSRRQLERERAWEADADAIAVSFLAQYLNELIDQTRINAMAAAVFGRDAHTVEHILSVTAVALFAVFAYVRGVRYRLGKRSSHPHPFVRSFYVKDMLFTAGRRQWPIDLAVLAELTDQRLDEMLTVLDDVGLSKSHLYDDAYLARAEAGVARIIATRAKHRKVCTPWAWVSWSGSEA